MLIESLVFGIQTLTYSANVALGEEQSKESGWMIWGLVMEKMAAAGNAASVYISHNREGGPAFNDRMKAQYQKRGY